MIPLKAFFALILGLAFQLAQVRADVMPLERPRTMPPSCACSACCCLENNTPQQRPAPAVAAEQVQKIAAIVEEQAAPEVVKSPIAATPIIADQEREFVRFTGYPGVQLSVAYCRYLL